MRWSKSSLPATRKAGPSFGGRANVRQTDRRIRHFVWRKVSEAIPVCHSERSEESQDPSPAKVGRAQDDTSCQIASALPGAPPRNDKGGNFSDLVKQLNHETSSEAEKWFREKRKVSLPVIFWKMIAGFFKVYFFEGAWREGFFGFMRAIHSSLFQLISYTKYWELMERERGRM